MIFASTKLGELNVRRAALNDLDTVRAIMVDAANCLESRGIAQWNWVLKDRGKEIISTRITNAEAYLVHDSSHQAIATFTLQWNDKLWGERSNDGLAGYIHGLTVHRCAAGRGLGLDLLKLASALTSERGRKYLRLDCMAQNPGLCEYYRRAGFTDLGVINPEAGTWSARLFERHIV